mmetsp:Transcript_17581/g.55990  ORF Transcript_17581/g.55990 Transcript_17581/m.55990 type:complete len:385 (+) Transcript_17581:280-1434(+)
MAVRVELARGVAPDRGVEGGVDVAEHDGAAGGEPLRPQACIVRHTAFLGQQEHRFVDGRREPQRLENDEPQLVIVAKREIEAGRRALRGGALFSRREGPDVEASKEAHHQRVGEGLWTEQPCDDRGGHELVDELGLAHAPGRVAVVVGPAQLARVFRDRLERLVVGERRRRGKDLSQRRDLLLNLRRVHFADDLARRDNHMPRRRWVVVLRPHRRAVDLVARVVPNVDADHSPKDQTRAKQIDEPRVQHRACSSLNTPLQGELWRAARRTRARPNPTVERGPVGPREANDATRAQRCTSPASNARFAWAKLCFISAAARWTTGFEACIRSAALSFQRYRPKEEWNVACAPPFIGQAPDGSASGKLFLPSEKVSKLIGRSGWTPR